MELNAATIAVSAAVLALFLMLAVALVQIAGHKKLSTLERAIWIVVVLIAPLVGAIAWFLVGRNGDASRWVRDAVQGAQLR